MRNPGFFGLVMLLAACGDAPPHIPELVPGEYRGTNSGPASMAPHLPVSWLRAVVLAVGGNGWECEGDFRFAACVDAADRSITLNCRGYSCELEYFDEYAGYFTAHYHGDTWSLVGTWGDRSFEAVRDGAGAFVSVSAE